MNIRVLAVAIALAAAGAAFAIWALDDRASAGVSGIPTVTPTPGKSPQPAPTSPSASPTPAPPSPVREGPAFGPGIMVAECRSTSPTSVRVIFLWTPSRAGQQWLDLSIFNNNWAPGTFIGLGPFGPDAFGFVWDGLVQGTPHFARVNTIGRTGWHTSETLAFYTPICDGSTAGPAPAPDMLALQARLASAAAQWSFSTAIAITDLQTGETIDVNGFQNRLPGCTINLFALMLVISDLQAGRYPEPAPGDLIGQTINRSDPITAERLIRQYLGNGDVFAGLRRVNEYMHGIGMTSTLMDHPPAYWHESLNGGIDNRITARDANAGLLALWDGRALSPGWRDYMLQKMTLVKPGLNYLIPAGVGYGATVSHKNGFLYAEGWADNDIGIVWFQRGGQRYGYAISFFTQHVAGKYDDIPLGQQVSALAWQWFTARYGYP